MTNHEEHSERHEQEVSPEASLKAAMDEAWKRYEENRTPGKENQHPSLTLYTPPDENGRYSKLTLGPYGFQGRKHSDKWDEYEGSGNNAFIKHRPSGIGSRQRTVYVDKLQDGSVSAQEAETESSPATREQADFFDATPGDMLHFARADRDYFVRLTELLTQAVPEKPKTGISPALGFLATKLSRKRKNG